MCVWFNHQIVSEAPSLLSLTIGCWRIQLPRGFSSLTDISHILINLPNCFLLQYKTDEKKEMKTDW